LTGCLFALGLLLANSAIAQTAKEQATAAKGYVDSVYNWGSWELGLEPAAGGPAALPERAMSNRPANVRFRPNDNSVFGVDNHGMATVNQNPSPTPAHVPPTSGPGTAPSGGPGDRF
jgi:hypothetical protein